MNNLEVNTEDFSSSFNPNRVMVEDVTSTVIESINVRKYNPNIANDDDREEII